MAWRGGFLAWLGSAWVTCLPREGKKSIHHMHAPSLPTHLGKKKKKKPPPATAMPLPPPWEVAVEVTGRGRNALKQLVYGGASSHFTTLLHFAFPHTARLRAWLAANTGGILLQHRLPAGVTAKGAAPLP